MKKVLLSALVLSGLGLMSCSDDEKSEDTSESEANEQKASDNATVDDGAEETEKEEVSTGPLIEDVYYGKKGENGMYGYVDSKGTWVVEPEYSNIGNAIRYGRGSVTNEDYLSGYVDEGGELVIPCQYRFASDFTEDGLASVKKSDEDFWRYINKDGETVLEANYDQCYGFWEGLASVTNSGKGMGLINLKGELVIPMDYYFQTYMNDEGGTYFYYGDKSFVKKHSNGKFGLLRNDGTEVTSFIYEGTTMYAEEHGVLIVKSGDKYGAIDLEGNELIPMEYDALSLYNMSKEYTAEKDGIKMKLDLQGNCVEGCN